MSWRNMCQSKRGLYIRHDEVGREERMIAVSVAAAERSVRNPKQPVCCFPAPTVFQEESLQAWMTSLAGLRFSAHF